MKKLSARQVGILLLINIVSLKFISFPAVFASFAGRDGYLGVIIAMLVDLAFLLLVIFVGKRNPNKTYEQIIKDKFGDLTLKFINLGLFLYFTAKTVFIIKEHHNYILEVLFTFMPWQAFVVPMLALMVFIMNRSLRAIGRASEIVLPVVLIGVFFTCAISIEYFEVSNLFPVLEYGLKPVLTSAFYSNFTTGDFLLLLMLLGRFKEERGAYKKILNYGLFATGIVIVFYIIFFGVFGNTVVKQSLAISDLPLFATFPKHIGRLDWITINIWTIILMFQTGVVLTFALHAFNKTFGLKRKTTGIAVIIAIIFVGSYVLFLNLADAIEIVTSAKFNIAIVVFEITAILILVLSSFKTKKVRYGKVKKDLAK